MKSWVEKRDSQKEPSVVKTEKKFADIPEGSLMLIATPEIVDAYVRQIPEGTSISLATLRNDLALAHGAEKTCPVTTGIFLRIVAEAAFEEYQKGRPLNQIAPFWRVVEPKSKIAGKLACGIEFIDLQRKKEGLNLL